jgi:hypothetical protein
MAKVLCTCGERERGRHRRDGDRGGRGCGPVGVWVGGGMARDDAAVRHAHPKQTHTRAMLDVKQGDAENECN